MKVSVGRQERMRLVSRRDESVDSVLSNPVWIPRFFFRPLQDGQKPTIAFLGDGGRISLVSLVSRQLTGTLKMAGSARAAAFSPDGSQLLSLGENLANYWPLYKHTLLVLARP